MNVELICIKDYVKNGEVHFEEGKLYFGFLKENYINYGINSFTLNSKHGKEFLFYTGSEYFDVN